MLSSDDFELRVGNGAGHPLRRGMCGGRRRVLGLMWRQFMTDLIVGGGEDRAGEGVEGDNGRATVRLGELGLPYQGAAIGSVQVQLVELAGLVLGREANGSWGGDPCGAGFP